LVLFNYKNFNKFAVTLVIGYILIVPIFVNSPFLIQKTPLIDGI